MKILKRTAAKSYILKIVIATLNVESCFGENHRRSTVFFYFYTSEKSVSSPSPEKKRQSVDFSGSKFYNEH